MGKNPGIELLTDLHQRGLTLLAIDGRLRIAPKSALTPELRETLTAHKADLLSALSLEARLIKMPLGQFEREGCPIEIRVPGLEKTIWFIPGEADIVRLAQSDVPRGRIWTAKELRVLWGGGPEARKDAITLARIKSELDGEVVSVENLRDSEQQEGPPE